MSPAPEHNPNMENVKRVTKGHVGSFSKATLKALNLYMKGKKGGVFILGQLFFP